MELDKSLYKEIKEYCEINGIKTKDYIHKLLKDAFMKDKYGEAPFLKRRVQETRNEEPPIQSVIIYESKKEDEIEKKEDKIEKIEEEKGEIAEIRDKTIYLPKSKKRKL